MTADEYLELIQREPKEISHGKGYDYIRKSVLQRELLSIYEGHTKWEMLRDMVTKNGLWGTGLLHVKHPSGEWLYYTGTASLPHEKKMRLNYPALEAQCFKNACKKIGPWFGQNLNLEEEDKEPEDELPVVDRADERLEMLIENATSIEQMAAYKNELKTPEHRKMYTSKLRELSQLKTNNI